MRSNTYCTDPVEIRFVFTSYLEISYANNKSQRWAEVPKKRGRIILSWFPGHSDRRQTGIGSWSRWIGPSWTFPAGVIITRSRVTRLAQYRQKNDNEKGGNRKKEIETKTSKRKRESNEQVVKDALAILSHEETTRQRIKCDYLKEKYLYPTGVLESPLFQYPINHILFIIINFHTKFQC